MKIIENKYDGNIIKKVVLDARLVNGLTSDSNPMHLKNEKMTPYHWVDVELLDVNGRASQRGSAIVWDTRFQDNPQRYAEGKIIPIEIRAKPTNSKVRFLKKFVKLFKKFVFISNHNTHFLPLL